MVVTPRVLTELRSAVRTRLDIEGAFTLTIGLALFVYGIVGTDTHSWGSSATIIALAGGALFILAALLIEAKTAVDPILPLSIFKRRSLSAANAIAVCPRCRSLWNVLLHLAVSPASGRLQPLALWIGDSSRRPIDTRRGPKRLATS